MLKKWLLLCLSPVLLNAVPSLLEKTSTLERYSTFYLAFSLMEERKAKILVETGTARHGVHCFAGDGCSTLLFAEWAKNYDAELFSVDIDPLAIAHAKQASGIVNPHVKFYNMDSLQFFEYFDQDIDFLYLDSLDFDSDDPLPSQEHHLKEIIAAHPHLHGASIILIDDCALPHGGKGKLVIEWLQERGWKVIMSKYQALLVRE